MVDDVGKYLVLFTLERSRGLAYWLQRRYAEVPPTMPNTKTANARVALLFSLLGSLTLFACSGTSGADAEGRGDSTLGTAAADPGTDSTDSADTAHHSPLARDPGNTSGHRGEGPYGGWDDGERPAHHDTSSPPTPPTNPPLPVAPPDGGCPQAPPPPSCGRDHRSGGHDLKVRRFFVENSCSGEDSDSFEESEGHETRLSATVENAGTDAIDDDDETVLTFKVDGHVVATYNIPARSSDSKDSDCLRSSGDRSTFVVPVPPLPCGDHEISVSVSSAKCGAHDADESNNESRKKLRVKS